MEIIVKKSCRYIPKANKELNKNVLTEFKSFLAKRGLHDKARSLKEENGQIIVSDLPSILIHGFTLHLESLGKQISYEKNTVIKIK